MQPSCSFKCLHCEFSSASKSSLKTHMVRCHLIQISCPNCHNSKICLLQNNKCPTCNFTVVKISKVEPIKKPAPQPPWPRPPPDHQLPLKRPQTLQPAPPPNNNHRFQVMQISSQDGRRKVASVSPIVSLQVPPPLIPFDQSRNKHNAVTGNPLKVMQLVPQREAKKLPLKAEMTSEESWFHCPFCSFRTRVKLDFMSHSKCHGVDKFVCDHCTFETMAETEMVGHLKQHLDSAGSRSFLMETAKEWVLL